MHDGGGEGHVGGIWPMKDESPVEAVYRDFANVLHVLTGLLDLNEISKAKDYLIEQNARLHFERGDLSTDAPNSKWN